jgi:flagellar biogenesis protein FliO
MDALSRLAWALPLVLFTGVGVMLVLKRFVVPSDGPSPASTQRLTVSESITLSDDTRVHLLHLDRKSAFLVVESMRNATLQSLTTQNGESPIRVPNARWTIPSLARLLGAGRR